MDYFFLILSMLFLCLSLQAGGANLISRHHSFLPRANEGGPQFRRADSEYLYDPGQAQDQKINLGSCSIEEFSKKLSSIQCQQSFALPALDIYAECGFNQLGEMTVDQCRTFNGKTCTELASDSINDLYSQCKQPIPTAADYRYMEVGVGSSSCSSQCSATVKNVIDELGCCFSVFDTVTESLGVNVPSLFDLASLCGMTPPLRCETPSTLSFTPSQITTLCSVEELRNRVLSDVSCNPQVQKGVIQTYRSCNYQLGIDSLAFLCRKNEDGVICGTLQNFASDTDVTNNCTQAGIPSSGTCTSSCRDALQTYRNDYGCCINTLFNDTTFTPPSADYELWSLCGVDTVGQCKSTLDPLIGSAVSHTITKAMILFALFTLLM